MTGNWQPGGAWPPQQQNSAPGGSWSSAPRRDTNGLAIAALILGIVWLGGIGALLAIILGSVALRQIKRSGESGRGLAIAGLTLGIIGFVLPAALVVAGLALSPSAQQVAAPFPTLVPSAQPAIVGLPSCHPAPCADYQGFVLRVVAVDRDFHPGPGGVDTPGPGFHIVRVTISFSDVTGEHGYSSGFDLSVVDPAGTAQSNFNTIYGRGCPAFLPDAQDMAPGGHAGPFDVCYPAGGSARGSLTLAWTPDFNMTGCDRLPSAVEAKAKPTGVIAQTDGCSAVLISLGT